MATVLTRRTVPRRAAQEAISVPSQTAITKDNVSVSIDAVIFMRTTDPYLASYGVDDAQHALITLAQTTMRSELGKLSLDRTFQEREALNASNEAALPWGIQCMRYEIRDIVPPPGVRSAMELEAEAERRKRAAVLDSEGDRDAAVNAAEGHKKAAILSAEASAEATRVAAEAAATALERLSQAVRAEGGKEAVAVRLGEQYISAFAKLAKETNTLILPSDAGDPGRMVATALAVVRSAERLASAPPSSSSAGASDAASERGRQHGERDHLPSGWDHDDAVERGSDWVTRGDSRGLGE